MTDMLFPAFLQLQFKFTDKDKVPLAKESTTHLSKLYFISYMESKKISILFSVLVLVLVLVLVEVE